MWKIKRGIRYYTPQKSNTKNIYLHQQTVFISSEIFKRKWLSSQVNTQKKDETFAERSTSARQSNRERR